jgi:ribosome-associated protein
VIPAIVVRPGVVVPSEAMEFRAVRSGGPGGQNVNKVSSKVELRVDLVAIQGLEPDARARLARLTTGATDAEGRLLVVSQLTRDQRRNLEDALAKVRVLVERALVRPRKRRPTRPSRGAVERRLGDKKARSRTKASRRGDD